MRIIWQETLAQECNEIMWEVEQTYWGFQFHRDMIYSSPWLGWAHLSALPEPPWNRRFPWWSGSDAAILEKSYRVFNTMEEGDMVWFQIRQDPTSFIVLATLAV